MLRAASDGLEVRLKARYSIHLVTHARDDNYNITILIHCTALFALRSVAERAIQWLGAGVIHRIQLFYNWCISV